MGYGKSENQCEPGGRTFLSAIGGLENPPSKLFPLCFGVVRSEQYSNTPVLQHSRALL